MKTKKFIIKELKNIKAVAPSIEQIATVLQVIDSIEVENFLFRTCKELRRVQIKIDQIINS